MLEAEQPHRTDHSSAGAIFAQQRLNHLGRPIAYCIAGHHSGLLDYTDGEACLEKRLTKSERLERTDLSIIDRLQLPEKLPLALQLNEYTLHQWVRMLFSCLVDADWLDTERFMQPEQSLQRGQFSSLATLKERLDAYMDCLAETAPKNELNRVRQAILQRCRITSREAPGLFSLTVPTGGGKTLASITWALEHALAHGKERIIVAIPYTSIISQTAALFRRVFGEANVVEHHSNLRDDSLPSGPESHTLKLAAENWDAPIVVTTNVQLFESLYAAKPSRCRKLHNLVNAVVVLDEVQMLPPEFLQPIVDSIKGLVEQFRTSILFTTATQPVLSGRLGCGQAILKGFDKPVREISGSDIDFSAFSRTRIEWPESNEAVSYSNLADELTAHEQVLCVVNTRREAKELIDVMPPDTFHLSRMMCSEHIMQTIDCIKARLRAGESVRVVSTQLIEAGVDIDFPAVYRAFAGLDSVIQAAGRCNREGRLSEPGRVVVFRSPHAVPQGLMRKGAETLESLLKFQRCADPLDSQVIDEYFRSFYSRLNSFDKPQISQLLYKNASDLNFMFGKAAEAFRLIDDRGSRTVLIPFGAGAELIDALRYRRPDREMLRRLQQYSVSVPLHSFEELGEAGALESVGGFCALADSACYDLRTGLQTKNRWLDELLLV